MTVGRDELIRRDIHAQALSLGVGLFPFGLAFGVACANAGLAVWEAIGFSTLVFGGSAQFAAVTVLAEDGTVAAAVTAGLLLNMRSLAFGMVMAPALRGPLWWRALVSQLMIDEATAVGSSQSELRWRRYGYLAGGLAVFVLWNLSTLLGVTVLSASESLITDLGFDAAIPAAFLALMWPRLAVREQRHLAGAGAVVALALAPFVPAGVPVIVAAAAVVLARPWSMAGVSG